MTAFVPAVIAICLSVAPTQCESHQVRIEPRACHLAPLRAEAPVQGAWQAVVINIRCDK